MAHMATPPDRALVRAIRDVLAEARTRGMDTRDIADHFEVSSPTISRWETGARLPALDLLPSFDKLVGRPRGYVLRLAGYVVDELDVRAAILTAPDLDEQARKVLADTYEALRRLPVEHVPQAASGQRDTIRT
jgi:transcriptional regulator with XRE-family HTH domain